MSGMAADPFLNPIFIVAGFNAKFRTLTTRFIVNSFIITDKLWALNTDLIMQFFA